MKKKWEYKYPERLVQAMVSEDHVLIGEKLYFVHMTNGSYPKAGIYCVDVNSGEAEAVYETYDFLRTVGVYRDGRFYFTSLRGNAYCVTTEGELKWTKLLGKEDGSVYFVNSVTGEEIKKKKKVKGACRGIAVCGGGIVALSDKGPAVGMQ